MDLLWHQHGGSGLNMSWGAVWELDWDTLTKLREEVDRRREAEAEAIRRARRGSR